MRLEAAWRSFAGLLFKWTRQSQAGALEAKLGEIYLLVSLKFRRTALGEGVTSFGVSWDLFSNRCVLTAVF